MPDDYFEDHERLAVIIDGQNLYGTTKALGIEIDYKLLRRWFAERARLLRIYYFTSVAPPTGDDNFVSVKPLADWLDYNGFAIETKPAKEFTDRYGNTRIKGGMDVEIAVRAMEIADTVDHLVLVSGNGDFRALVEALQRRGKRVTVMSTLQVSPPMVADELRRQADQFLDIDDIADAVRRSEEAKAKRNVAVATRRARSAA